MRILITGGCGFIGSNIAIFLKKRLKNYKIYSLDSLTRRGSILNRDRLKEYKIKNFKINIENFKKINNLQKFDLIIDCCAEPAIELSHREPDRVFNTNLIGTFNILKKCIKDKANIIFLSSSRVYSISVLKKIIKKQNIDKPIKSKIKIDETFDTSSPCSLYGFTKLCSEKLIQEFSFVSNIKYIINRFGVIAGPWQFGKQDQGFISLWIWKHMNNKQLSYTGFGGTGSQIRDVVHIKDVCKLITLQVRKIKKIYNITINVGGGKKNAISLKNLTKLSQKITSNKIKISSIKKTSIYDVPYYVTDNSKVKKVYNWIPQESFLHIMKDVYKWMYSNKKILKKYIK